MRWSARRDNFGEPAIAPEVQGDREQLVGATIEDLAEARRLAGAAELGEQRLDVVSAGRTYDIFNANGWGRSLHFLAGWFFVATGLAYLFMGVANGHFGRRLWPTRGYHSAANPLGGSRSMILRPRVRMMRQPPE